MSKVSRNIIYNGLGQGLSVLLSFVAVRLVFRRLGGDALGLIYFSLAVSAALSVAVQLGICESAVREVASHQGNRPEYIKSFIRTSSSFYWVAFLLLALLTYWVSPYLVHHWVKLDSLDKLTAIKVMRILTLGALVALPGGLYRALLTGLQHMGITNLIDVIAKALQQSGIFVLLLVHGSLSQVAYWICASMALQVIVTWAVCTRYFSVQALLFPGFSRAVVKENIGFASGLFTITVCSWITSQMDRIIISKLLPLSRLGTYTFARGAINQGMLLTGSISSAIFPHFSALYAAGNTAELRRMYDKIQDLICFATIPVFAGVPFATLPLFSRAFDMPTAHLLLLPCTFLAVGYYLNGAIVTPYMVSLAVGRPDITARQNALALLIVPIVSTLAIYWFGLNGAGFSWVVYHIYALSYGLPRICRECIGIAPRLWYWHVFRIMVVAGLIYGSIWGLIAWRGNFSLGVLATGYAVGSIIYGGVAFAMMGDSLRSAILQYIRRGRGLVEQVAVAP